MSGERETHAYDDIIGLPHSVSTRHPQMPLCDRAAQFSPFAALSGYEDAVREEARLTGRRIELSEEEKALLDAQLAALAEKAARRPQIAVTWFVPDARKEGGEYVTTAGAFKRLDEAGHCILLADGCRVPIEDILQLEEL